MTRRILMTTDCLTGVWTCSLDLARGLAVYGVETTLAILGPAPDAGQEGEAGTVPGLQFLATGLPPLTSSANESEIEQAGIAVARFANIIDADIVHLNDPILAAHGHFRAPVVAVCDANPAAAQRADDAGERPDGDLRRADLLRRAYEAADVLIASTVALAATTQTFYGLPRAPLVVRHGRRLAQAAQPPYPIGDFAIAVWRSPDSDRNLKTLNRAASRLAIPVMAVGPLRDTAGDAQFAESWPGAADLGHLWTLGALPEPELARWLETAPVFVSCASAMHRGLSVIEAAQAGCALVLSDIPAYRELWGEAAVFVPPDDDRAIAAAIESLVADKPRREELAAAARDRAQDYSVEAMTAAMMAIYRSLDDARQRARRREGAFA